MVKNGLFIKKGIEMNFCWMQKNLCAFFRLVKQETSKTQRL